MRKACRNNLVLIYWTHSFPSWTLPPPLILRNFFFIVQTIASFSVLLPWVRDILRFLFVDHRNRVIPIKLAQYFPDRAYYYAWRYAEECFLLMFASGCVDICLFWQRKKDVFLITLSYHDAFLSALPILLLFLIPLILSTLIAI